MHLNKHDKRCAHQDLHHCVPASASTCLCLPSTTLPYTTVSLPCWTLAFWPVMWKSPINKNGLHKPIYYINQLYITSVRFHSAVSTLPHSTLCKIICNVSSCVSKHNTLAYHTMPYHGYDNLKLFLFERTTLEQSKYTWYI